MTKLFSSYESQVSPPILGELHQLGSRLTGRRVVHVNSTRMGNGAGEILKKEQGRFWSGRPPEGFLRTYIPI